jgi:16S rRNA (guanine527-N7)-methyltransferase
MAVDTDFAEDDDAMAVTSPDASSPGVLLPGAPPPPPPAAAAVFGPALDEARAFAGMLATRGVEWGLIGPHEVARLWDRHLLNCAVVADLIGSRYQTLVDIGSGAGLPGIVLAMMRPELTVTLLEPMERRCRFLSGCVAELGLANANVLRGRAEDATLRADVATARAVAPLDRLAELAVRVVRPGGLVLAIKGQAADAELRKALAAPRLCGRGKVRSILRLPSCGSSLHEAGH